MATLWGNAGVGGTIYAVSQLTIIDRPNFELSVYTDYPSRIPVNANPGPNVPNWATQPGILQGLDYILDLRIPNLPIGTQVTFVPQVVNPNPHPLPTVTALDGGIIQANGVTRYKVRFATASFSGGTPLNYLQALTFTTDFGSIAFNFQTYYNNVNRPVMIPGSLPAVYNGTGTIFIPINSYIDILLIGAGGGGSGSTFNYTPATIGLEGESAHLFVTNINSVMQLVQEPGDTGLNIASGVGGRGATLNSHNATNHFGPGGAAFIASDSGVGLTGGDAIVSNVRMTIETIFRRDGLNGRSIGTDQGGGEGIRFPFGATTGTRFGQGGQGGDITGDNFWGYGGGGGSGGALVVRLIYRNIPTSGASADLRARSQYVPPLQLFLRPNDLIVGGTGGTGRWNGGNGTNGRVMVIDYGAF